MTVCAFHPGRKAVAEAPQSIDLGKTIEWVPVCETHEDSAQDWWEGADWGPLAFRSLEVAS